MVRLNDSASIKMRWIMGSLLADAVLDAINRQFQLLQIKVSPKLNIHG